MSKTIKQIAQFQKLIDQEQQLRMVTEVPTNGTTAGSRSTRAGYVRRKNGGSSGNS